MRVAVLKQLWKRADPSPGRRLRRHAFYQRIAAHAPDLWARCGSEEQRANALKDPRSQNGSRPATVIVEPWNAALRTAFNGLEFKHVTGSKNQHDPNGHWTDDLMTVS